MEEEAQGLSVEDDGVEASTEAPAPETPETPQAAQPEAAHIEVVEGEKRVPLAALLAEREQNKQLRQSADRAADLERQLNELRPYADFVKANPQLMRQPEPEAQKAQALDPHAERTARLMDFYKADGSLDTGRASEWLAIQDERSQRQAAQAMQPLQEDRFQSMANVNFQRALQLKDADGNGVDPDSLRAVCAAMRPEDLADPRQMSIAYLTAVGMSRTRTKSKPAAPASEPLITEASGGHPASRVVMSGIETKIARDRGMNDKTWADRTKGWERGRGGVLEE